MKLCRTLIVAAIVILAACGTPTAAQAHSTVSLTINHDGRGSISVDVTWADEHPVTGTVAATMMAVSPTARQVGPVALTRLPDRSTVVLPGALPAGRWQVVVDVAVPGIGHCEASVEVATPAATASSTRCAEPTPAAGAPGQAAGVSDDGGAGRWWLIAFGVAVVVVLAAAVVVRRRRAGPGR